MALASSITAVALAMLSAMSLPAKCNCANLGLRANLTLMQQKVVCSLIRMDAVLAYCEYCEQFGRTSASVL